METDGTLIGASQQQGTAAPNKSLLKY